AAEPTTILLVTHDVEEALYLADRVLLLRSLHGTASDHEDAPVVPRPAARAVALGSAAGIGALGAAAPGRTTEAHEQPAAAPVERGSIARIVTVPGARPRGRADR